MNLDIPALDLQVRPLRRGEDVALGAGVEAAGGAGEGHFLVGRRRRLAALALQADHATGGVQVGAGFLVGFVLVAGFADGEEDEAGFDGQAVVALGDQVGVLAGGEAQAFAAGQDEVGRGELGDAAGGSVVQARLRPGGDGAAAAAGGFDVAFAGRAGARALRAVEDLKGVGQTLADRELVGLGLAFEAGVLFLRDVGQAGGEALGVFCLGDGFAAVEVVTARTGPGVGAEQQAAAGAQRDGALGGEFGAVAAVGQAGVVVLLLETAELESAVLFGGAEFDARLAGGVVEDELVVAALPGLAGVELLGFEAGEAGAVLMGFGFFAGEEGGGVGAGLHGAAAELVALGVGAALAVVEAADDEGAVDVAVLEGDEDFLAGAGNHMATPVGAGNRGHDAEPDAERMAGRGVVAAAGVGQTVGRLAAALPGELDADAPVAVGVGRVTRADDDGGEGAVGARAGVDPAAVGIGHERAPGNAGADGLEFVAVEVDAGVVVFVRTEGIDGLGDGFGEVVAGVVGDAGDQEAAGVGAIALVFGVFGEAEAGARGGGAHGAAGVVLLGAGVEGLALVAEHAFAVGGALPGVLAGVVVGDELGGLAAALRGVLDAADGALRAGREAAVVPADGVEFGGVELAQAMPAVDAVLSQRGAGLGEAEGGLAVVLEGAVVVGDDEAVAAQGFAVVGLVFEPAEEAFFGEQAFEEVEVGFLVLHGQAALGVGRDVGEVPAPLGGEFALGFPVAEEFVDDFNDAAFLEEVAVAPVAEKGEPGFDDQPVAGKATVGAKADDFGDVAVEGARELAQAAGLQVQAGRLAEQGGQGLVGVAAEGGELDAKAGVLGLRAKGFDDARGFGDQRIGAGRCGERLMWPWKGRGNWRRPLRRTVWSAHRLRHSRHGPAASP
jgi:hypothetical protein